MGPWDLGPVLWAGMCTECTTALPLPWPHAFTTPGSWGLSRPTHVFLSQTMLPASLRPHPSWPDEFPAHMGPIPDSGCWVDGPECLGSRAECGGSSSQKELPPLLLDCQEMESGCHSSLALLYAQACTMAWAARAWSEQNQGTCHGLGKITPWAEFGR